MPDEIIKLEGWGELHDALGKVKKSTERARLRKVAKDELVPVIEKARDLVPVDEGFLRDSLTVGTKVTRSVAREKRREGKFGVQLFAGTANRNGVPREFGSWRTRAEPFLRPAWDSRVSGMLDRIKAALGGMVEKDAAKAGRKGR